MAQAVDFREVGQSQYSSHGRAELLVFRSADDWSRHRAMAHREGGAGPGAGVLAGIDWSARMLVEVALGERGSAGYSVQVVGVLRDGELLRVRAVEVPPAPGMVSAAVMTQPSAYVETLAHHGAVTLEIVES